MLRISKTIGRAYWTLGKVLVGIVLDKTLGKKEEFEYKGTTTHE